MLMNKTKFHIILVLIFVLFDFSTSAIAITFGQPDGNDHPYVVQLIFYDYSGNFITPCTGTLISPTVVLTAAHCMSGADNAIVLLDDDLSGLPDPTQQMGQGCDYFDGFNCYETNGLFSHPDYNDAWPDFPNTYDVGILILSEKIDMDEYGALPDLGVLDDFATQRGLKDLILRTVGYGLQSVKPFYQFDHLRYTSTSMLVNLRSRLTDGYNLHTSNNPGRGNGMGGQCFGDSGGPVFYPEDSNIVVGIVSFGQNWNCKGADFAYRTDIIETQSFILDYLLNGH